MWNLKAPKLLKTFLKCNSFYRLKLNFFDNRDIDHIIGHTGHQKWNCDHWMGRSSKLGDLSPFHLLTISKRMSDRTKMKTQMNKDTSWISSGICMQTWRGSNGNHTETWLHQCLLELHEAAMMVCNRGGLKRVKMPPPRPTCVVSHTYGLALPLPIGQALRLTAIVQRRVHPAPLLGRLLLRQANSRGHHTK